jgi:hypothetical protein
VTIVCRLAAILIVCVIGQAATLEPRRFGWVGERLTDAEMAEIGQLASSAGGRPWLVLGQRSMALGVAFVDVYLQPDRTAGQVSRGRLLRLIADDQPTVQRRSAWRVLDTKSFAYVAAAGHPPLDIRSEQDLAWPFAVEGEFDDGSLVSLVGFIRSSPPIPDVPEGRIPRQVTSAPIYVIARRDATIVVGLRLSANQGQTVTLVQDKGRWRIINYVYWVT